MLLSFLLIALAFNKLDQLGCLDGLFLYIYSYYLHLTCMLSNGVTFKKKKLFTVIKSDEYNVYDRLFELQNYSPSIRPVNAWNETLNIETFISLIKIADVVSSTTFFNKTKYVASFFFIIF